MFKEITIYAANFNGASITEDALIAARFVPCGPSQDRSIGFSPPRGHDHGALSELVAGQQILQVTIETKSVPKQAVDRALDQAAAHIEQTEGRKPGRKELRELREGVVQELLPHAFPKTKSVLVWVNSLRGLIVVGSASQSVTDDVASLLVKVAPGLEISSLNTAVAPQAAMTNWLAGGADEWPEHFSPGRFVELHSGDEMKSVVKFDRHNLDDDQMRLHIGQGKLPTKLALDWDGRVSFVLTDGTKLKKLNFLDGVFESASVRDDKVDGFDADVTITTGELFVLIDDLIKALGGQLV